MWETAIKQKPLETLNKYEQFSYGFFGMICLGIGIIVHVNHNFELYDYYFGELALSLQNLLIKMKILTDYEYDLPLYKPLVKCNSEHDIHNSITIFVNETHTKKTDEEVPKQPEELV